MVDIWASNTNFSAGPYAGVRTTKIDPSASELADGIVAGQTVKGQHVNAFLNALSRASAGLFGDGSDGAVTITGGTTTLTRDMYYSDLTVEGTGILATDGFRVFVSGTLTIDVGGVVHCNGADGATGQNGGIAGGVGGGEGSIRGGEAGGAGATQETNGTAGSSSQNAIGGAGGAGGDSPDGATNTGGAGGSAAAPAATDGGWRHLDAVLGRLSGVAFAQLEGGAGGGGGAGGATGYGGSGGGGGGLVSIHAFRLINNGTISADGGAGGDGGAGDGGAGGGGGGGGGGAVLVACRVLSGSGTMTAAGGAGGTPEASGTAGTAGSAGTVLQLYA